MMIMLLLITRQLVIVLIAAFGLLVRSLNAWFVFCGYPSSFGFGVAFFFAAGVAATFGVGVGCNDATNRGS